MAFETSVLHRFLTIFLLLSFAPSAGAGSVCSALNEPRVEIQKFPVSRLKKSWNDFDTYPRFDYSGRKRVLFLSDGGKSRRLSAGDTLFISTDYQPSRNNHARIDNNALPFLPGSMDLIIMNRGLCPCHSTTKTCGGLSLNPEAIRDFIASVATTLNPRNPASLSVLTGFYFPGSLGIAVPEMFFKVLPELQLRFPQFVFQVLQDPSLPTKDGFMGVAIHVKGTSLEDNLRYLMAR